MASISPNAMPPASAQLDIKPLPAVASQTKPKSKPRKRVNTAEKRSQHNAIERARRETLNTRFIDLARLLPSLVNHKRPSKSAIVNGSIKHLTYQRGQRLIAAKNLRDVVGKYDALVREVNMLRQQIGIPAKDESSLWNAEMEEICSVETESFGTFANFDGDDADDDEGELSIEQAANMAASFTGLITPRSSTEIDPMMHAQAMFGNMPVPPATATTTSPFDAINWPTDFASAMGQAANVQASHPFMMMPERVDTSSSASPANSQPGAVVTPPTSASIPMPFDHTPSPQSSLGPEEPKAGGMTAGLSAAQLFGLQYMPPTQAVSQGSQLPQQFARPALNTLALQQQIQQLQQQQQQQQQAVQIPSFENNPFTQNMFASTFPGSTASMTAQNDIQQWRKATGVQRSASLTPNEFLPRNNMGLTLNADGLWLESRAVAGF